MEIVCVRWWIRCTIKIIFCLKQREVAGIDCIIVYPARQRSKTSAMNSAIQGGQDKLLCCVTNPTGFTRCGQSSTTCGVSLIAIFCAALLEALTVMRRKKYSTTCWAGSSRLDRQLAAQWGYTSNCLKQEGKSIIQNIRSCSNHFLTNLLFINTKWCPPPPKK